DKRMAELYQMMEKALIYNSQRYIGTASVGRMSGGLNYWIGTKTNLSSAQIAFDDIEDAMQTQFTNFGLSNVPDTLWVNAWARRVISSWGFPTVRTDRTETAVGTQVDVIETNFGN